ncbi:MAG: hypothetical protein ACXW2E_00360 [Nitrososphaeraceae archaeon]
MEEANPATEIDLKEVRKMQLVQIVEQQLRHNITIAAELDKTIKTAKTATKAAFYKKRLNKVTKSVKSNIGMLQLLNPKLLEGKTNEESTTD